MFKQQFEFISRYREAYRFFKPYLDQFKFKLGLLVFGVLGIALTNTLMLWLMGLPFEYLANQRYTELATLLAAIFLVVIVNQAFHFVSTYGANIVGLRFVGVLRLDILKRVLYSPVLITEKLQKGDVLTRLSYDVDKTQNVFIESPLFFASHIFTACLYLVMLFYIDWNLALISLCLLPLYIVHQQIFARRKRIAAENFFHANGRLLAQEDEYVANTRLISSYNAQPVIEAKHHDFFAQAFNWAKRERMLDVGFTVSLAIAVYFCALLIVYLGIQHINEGSIGIAALMSFLLYLGYVSVPVRGITQLIFQCQSDLMASKRIMDLYGLIPRLVEKQPAIMIQKGEINVADLTFEFGDKMVFRKVSFYLPAGKTVAIVGESGVGKSTFSLLLMRYLSPGSGAIKIDGQDISQFSLSSLRNFVTIVWQQPLMFNDTIKANLLLARPAATEEELAQACIRADAAGFIAKLPQGLDTPLGVNGVELSLGQKQRVQLAQAFLRDTPILILDEASSALDSLTEEKIVRSLQEYRKNKTTLIIAHRYSSIRFVDEVMYLNGDGSLTISTHEELIKHNENYRKAIKWQAVSE